MPKTSDGHPARMVRITEGIYQTMKLVSENEGYRVTAYINAVLSQYIRSKNIKMVEVKQIRRPMLASASDLALEQGCVVIGGATPPVPAEQRLPTAPAPELKTEVPKRTEPTVIDFAPKRDEEVPF